MNKDFFDQEFDKVQETAQTSPQPQMPQANRGHKALWISLGCIALVIAMIFGWVLGSLFTNSAAKTSGEAVIDQVFKYLRNNYYQDIPEDKWQEAIAKGGTAILQTAGDQYCRLMTPEEYYEYNNPVISSSSHLTTYFGLSYQFVKNLGIYVSEVTPDSSCYGVLQPGDIVVKMSNVQYVLGQSGPAEYDLSKVDGDDFGDLMQSSIRKATFHVLRGGAIETFNIERGAIGVSGVPAKYQYQYVEFYFYDAEQNAYITNVSTTNQNYAKTNTKQLRHLDLLPADTGYVRISSFMYHNVTVNGKQVEVNAHTEFAEVMELFRQLGLKRLVLDLKDNPGGRVDVATQIAAMLITDARLDNTEKSTLRGGLDQEGNRTWLMTRLVYKNSSHTDTYYLAPSYNSYFSAPTSASAPCDIVFWTDSGSASASELLSGALIDYKTGFQIGTTTFGKGIAQVVKKLPFQEIITVTDVNGRQVKVSYNWAIYFTAASYYSPLGINIHGDGYTPKDGYDGITDYSDLWTKTKSYWNIAA